MCPYPKPPALQSSPLEPALPRLEPVCCPQAPVALTVEVAPAAMQDAYSFGHHALQAKSRGDPLTSRQPPQPPSSSQGGGDRAALSS